MADSAHRAARAIPTAKQHREIYEAIRQRDPAKAAKLMRGHISGMKERVLESLHRPSSSGVERGGVLPAFPALALGAS